MSNCKSVVLAATLGVLAASTTTHASVITFKQVSSGYQHDDAFVNQATPTATGNTTRILSGRTLGPPAGDIRLLFSFPLTGIPALSTIDSVTLTLTQEADTGTSVDANYTVELRSISEGFTEATATWNNTFGGTMTLGSTALSSLSLNPETIGANPKTFASSTSWVALTQAAFNANQPLNFAMVVPSVEGGLDRVMMRFYSSDQTNPTDETRAPILTVNYTEIPEPASLGLLGLSGLLLRRRR